MSDVHFGNQAAPRRRLLVCHSGRLPLGIPRPLGGGDEVRRDGHSGQSSGSRCVLSVRTLLVVPRRHIAGLDELAPGDDAIMGRVIRSAASIARDRHLERDGCRTVINCGEAAGQTVFHIHVHVLGGRTFGWPPG